MIVERLQQLRSKMKEHGMSAYIIPTADFHQSEYVGDYFTARKYMSGFTGSAGVLVVTMDKAGLWTDGRYFIQAARQLEGSTIELYKQGVEGVATIEEFLQQELAEGSKVGFDGRVIDAKWGKKLEEALEHLKVSFVYDEDLVDACWADRPSLSKEAIFLLEEQYAGEAAASKIERVRSEMKELGATTHILTTLDDIAWLLNVRGNDVLYNPVVLSYVVVTMEKVYYFVDEEKVPASVKEYFDDLQVELLPYDRIYQWVRGLKEEDVVLYDGSKLNYAIVKSIPADVRCIDRMNPTILMKAIKNTVEVDNLIKAHVKDGVAVTKFMHWLKTNVGKIPMTEITASDYLEERRKEQEDYISLSFDTICAYKENAAMMHYSATEESHAVLQPEGLLLVDSGGQYYQGTTDITRTFALGEVEYEQKKHFTAVVRSMLNLSDARFLHGCSGLNLDILARGPIWEMDLDYRCGTGHGVGYLLNVHEAPNGFRWKLVPERNDSSPLEAGMVTTNEPGIYVEGSHGIRIENELVCRKGTQNEYGQFMQFETITMAPIDLDAIVLEEMTEVDRRRLNAYHKNVYEVLCPYMNEAEREWLKEYTREI